MSSLKYFAVLLIFCLIPDEVKGPSSPPTGANGHSHNTRSQKRPLEDEENAGQGHVAKRAKNGPTKVLHGREFNLKDEKERRLYDLYRPINATPKKTGMDLMLDNFLNKDMVFTLEERIHLRIHGLLPPAFMTEDQQAYRFMKRLRKQPDDIHKYIQLDDLQDRNEKLFYRVLTDNLEELMPIVYTPTVGKACLEYGDIYRNPKGLYITINDNSIDKIYQILSNWPVDDVRAIVVTDGERILGLGDLGAYGIGIPIGKLALYVALARIDPRWTLPIMIDVGTNNKDLRNDPFYIGLRRERPRGDEYTSLIDNFMIAVNKKYGRKVLVQFEDWGNKDAYRLLDRYKNDYCMFNDDIQGTAAVAVAGLITAAKENGTKIKDTKYFFFGAGGAAMGIADLLVMYMNEREGISVEKARAQIYLMDKEGLITDERMKLEGKKGEKEKLLDDRHKDYAKNHPKMYYDPKTEKNDLLSAVKDVKPNAIIGVSTVGGAFTHQVIESMKANNRKKPIIFALSNPDTSSECKAEDAYKLTNGNVLFASGSPFPPVTLTIGGKKKTFYPSQGNNAYIFPGVALGVILFQVATISNELFLIAAEEVAKNVGKENLREGRLYPKIPEIPELSIKIAIAIAKKCYADGTAKLFPRPEEQYLEPFIRSQMYSVEYENILGESYTWPTKDMVAGFPSHFVPGSEMVVDG